ncbi:MAG: hypothetical protein ABWK15_09475 [Dissulfuribacterales bacterium]
MPEPSDRDNYITKIKDFFNQHMAATALAEEGLSKAALEVLNTKPTVLLVVEGEGIGTRTLKYAVDLCHRTSSVLDILHVHRPDAKTDDSTASMQQKERTDSTQFLTTREAQQKGMLDIPFREHTANGRFKDTITSFLRTRKQVISVVLEKLTYSRSASLKKLPLGLPCPLITI